MLSFGTTAPDSWRARTPRRPTLSEKPAKAKAAKTAKSAKPSRAAAPKSPAKPGRAAAPKPKSAAKPKIIAKAKPMAAAKAPKAVKAVKPVKAVKAKPVPAKPARPEILDAILKCLDDGKAEDIQVLDLTGRSPMTDYMVVASGRSQRHVAALAEQLQDRLKHDFLNANIEGLPACDWVLVDALDVVVHLFRPEVRAFYNLEQMWSDAPSEALAG
jgi:ribosome-associated protein